MFSIKKYLDERKEENTGHIFIEFGPDGQVRTLNNESPWKIHMDADGDIHIIGGHNVISNS